MINNKLNNELKEYIENNIFPLYSRNEEGHGISHIKDVIKRSLNISKDYDVDINLVYTIASYHDLGHYIDRKTHEIISAKMFMKDENMKGFFSDEERKIIKEAIEDHRTSSDHEPRSIYGKIVSTADRTLLDIETPIKRTYSYEHILHPNFTKEEKIEDAYNHINNKFGRNGYAKIYLKDPEYDESLEKLRKALDDKEEFIKKIYEIVDKEGL